MNYLLTKGVLVNEGRQEKACLWIKDGVIGGIFPDEISAMKHPSIPTSIEKISAESCFIIPGVIDDQVHFREPGLTYKGDIFSESRAAVAGGVTSFMEMPNTNPPTLTQELLQQKYDRAAAVSAANYSFYMGCSEDNLEEVLKTNPKTVCGIKIFLGSSTGNMLVKNPVYIETLLKNAPTIVAAHCEEEPIMLANAARIREQYGENPPFEVHPLIRSSEACYASSSKVVEIARRVGARFHLLHISTLEELYLLDNVEPTLNNIAPTLNSVDPTNSIDPTFSKPHITGEVCVHHLWFTDKDYKEKQGFIKWNPAIKSERDREALRAAVREKKVVVATDHAPHTLEEKQAPYFSCPSGGPLVQHSLQLMLEMVKQGVFTIEDVVDAMCHRPAKLFSVEKRGFLREGYAADIVVIKPSVEPHKEPIRYKCAWSPFAEIDFSTEILYTFVNGRIAYKKGSIIDEKYGQRLHFAR